MRYILFIMLLAGCTNTPQRDIPQEIAATLARSGTHWSRVDRSHIPDRAEEHLPEHIDFVFLSEDGDIRVYESSMTATSSNDSFSHRWVTFPKDWKTADGAPLGFGAHVYIKNDCTERHSNK